MKIHETALYYITNNMDFPYSHSQYLFLYPYQIGIVSFFSLLYKIFGYNFMVAEYANVIFSVINTVLLYIISQKIFKEEKFEKILIILLDLFSIYWMFFNVHVYGNIVGLTFALFAILFTVKYLDSYKFYNLIITGISITIAILLKTNYCIFLIGILLVLVLDIIQKWNLKFLAFIPIILICYFVINIGYNFYIEKKFNVNIPDGVPMISFIYMGLTDSDFAPGWYNSKTLDIYYDNNCNTQKTATASKELINERLTYFFNNPSESFNFFSQKIGSTWLNPTFQTVFYCIPGIRYIYNQDYATYINYHQTILSIVVGPLYSFIENVFNIYQMMVFITAGIGLFILNKFKKLDSKKLLLPIIFFGGFLFHLIWETKAIYVIQYYFILLPYASYGIRQRNGVFV